MKMGSNVWGVARDCRYIAFLGSCAVVALMVTSTHAVAEPHMEGEVAVELAGNHTKQGSAKQNDINPTIEVAAAWVITDAWSVQSGFTLESIYDGDADFYFKNLALSTDELYLQYEAGMFRVFAGKINPTFGTAWDITPGIYGTEFAEDYELGEGYIAAGGGMTLDGVFGKHILTATAFRLDRSLLTQTALTNNRQVTYADGGLSNTRGFKSFSVTLDSENIFGLNGINAHLGCRKQAKGVTEAADETGLVAGLSAGYDLSADLKLEMMAEYAGFSNYGGTANADANYVTVGAGLGYKGYNLALAYTMKEDAGTESTLLSASIGTEIWNEWALDVGYALATEDGLEDRHAIGFTLAKSFEFSSGQ